MYSKYLQMQYKVHTFVENLHKIANAYQNETLHNPHKKIYDC